MTTRSASSAGRINFIGLLLAVVLLGFAAKECSAAYYGKPIGKLSELHHAVSGEVFAVDGRTLFIKDFSYDGEGPAAYFYAGSTKSPSGSGFRVRDERGTANVLKKYRKKDITLTLPDGKTLGNIKWFSVWCDEFSVNFGDVKIPRGFDYPKPQKLGSLSGVHGVSSEPIVIVDAQTLLISGFSYDGEAPDAKFWVGFGPSPSPQGIRVPDENGKEQPLRRYDRKTIVLTLPGDLTVHQLGHFGVWCEAFTVDFGHIQIPQGLNVPPSLKMLGVSPQNVHRGGQGQTLAQLNLYEHSATSSSSSSATSSPPARPTSFASSLLLQQQHRPTTYRPILRRDDQVQVVQAVDYRIPKSLQLQEPLVQLQQSQHASYTAPTGRSLRYGDDADVSGVDRSRYFSGLHSEDDSPHEQPLAAQARSQALNKARSRTQAAAEPQQNSYSRSKLNCEVLEDSLAFEVRWAVAGDSIVVQLVGKLEDNQYMSFGLSAYAERSIMVGADVVVAWVDKHTLQGYAVDYILDAKSQCSGGRGSCPDTKVQDNTNSVRLLNAALVNGYSIVTYQRPLRASDELDLPILANMSQAIVWAIGPLNERLEVSFHTDYLKNDRFIEFGRPPAWNCPMPEQDQSQKHTSESDVDVKESRNQEVTVTTRRPQRLPATPAPASQKDAWEIPPIECYEPDDGTFYAQMGPTGGKHGYPAITGHVGWGISWYINGLLIPEINVVRGRNYTFVTEGGHDADKPALYHPFYITDDPVGGYQHKTPEEKAKVRIFAGVRRQRGVLVPTGTGRLCNWTPNPDGPSADEFTSFGAYQRTLSLVCETGEPGWVTWTPDADTPDTVYYQCFSHRYLGWKINVLDSCGTTNSGAASENHEVYALPEGRETKGAKGDLEGSESMAVLSKVTPSAEFLQQHLHHPDREAAGPRYPAGHTATNPGKLSTQPHMPLLTNANSNHFERLQSPPSSSSSSSSYEEAYGPRAPYAVPSHHRSQYKHHASASSTYRDQMVAGATRSASYPGGKQTATEVQEQDGQHPSNQQLSNLVPDGPRPLSHPAKYTYTAVGSAGPILYSRVPQHYASNYHYSYHHPLHHRHHYHHQPEQRATQLMIIKRAPSPPPSVLMRRPMLQSHPHSMPSSALSHAPSPIFIERKKAVFRLPSSTYRVAPEKLAHANGNQITKLMMKLDSPKARSKLEAKVSQVSVDLPDNVLGMLKPARNTGFDPSSIVIEGGFRPIVRDGPFDVAQKRMLEGKGSQSIKTNPEYRSKDNFEPVFIPSPPVADAAKKSKKKTRNSKQQLDEIDDMEMAAADRVESYYLPPVATTRLEELPNPSSGVLITFDGKKLKDSSLTRSITGIEEHSSGGLSSSILSRTPQFGKFKGELPPPIPGDLRPDTAPEHTKRRQPNIDLSLPEPQLKKNTKLILVGRSKRSAHESHIADPQHVQKNTSSIDFHQPEGDHSQVSEIASAGETILSNIGYIFLTIVCYYII